MKLNRSDLAYAQVDAAFKYIYDNPKKYQFRQRTLPALVDVYEFGVYNGNSLVKICGYIRYNSLTGVPVHVHGFDSFEGLPEEKDGVQVFDKFGKGAYKATESPETLNRLLREIHSHVNVHKCWFNELSSKHTGMKALLIHIDCDLYISTKQALQFMASNQLIGHNTLIAYDEYESTYNPESSGERKAHEEVLNKEYGMHTDEIWHNIYYDKDNGQRIRQSVWEVVR